MGKCIYIRNMNGYKNVKCYVLSFLKFIYIRVECCKNFGIIDYLCLGEFYYKLIILINEDCSV